MIESSWVGDTRRRWQEPVQGRGCMSGVAPAQCCKPNNTTTPAATAAATSSSCSMLRGWPTALSNPHYRCKEPPGPQQARLLGPLPWVSHA